MNLSILDWLIIAGYGAISLLVGFYYIRRASQNTDEYFLSGRTLPWWLAGTSMVATSFASDTPLVITGWVREYGISYNWIWWSFLIGGMFSTFVLARLWRRAEVVTDVELAELRYGGRSARYLRGFNGIFFSFFINCWALAWVILGMSKIIEVTLELDKVISIAICLSIALSYTVASGYWGVVVTDFIQFFIAVAGAIFLAVISVHSPEIGGVTGLKAQLGNFLDRLNFIPTADQSIDLFSWDFWNSALSGFLIFIGVQWWANKNSDGGGVIVQRINSTRDPKHAFLSTLWYNIAHYALRPWPWIMVALASLVVYPTVEGFDNEKAYPLMIIDFLPEGLLGLMIASLFAAFMSTVVTHLNLASAYFVNDLYKRFIMPKREEKHYILISRIMTVIFMLWACGIALVSDSISDLFKFLLAFSSGVGPVYLLRWFWWRINAWSEIAAMGASIVFTIAAKVMPSILGIPDLPYQLLLLFVVVSSGITWVIVTFITKPVEPAILEKFYQRVQPGGFWKPISSKIQIEVTSWKVHLLNWIFGIIMVYGFTFGLGHLCLAEYVEAMIYSGVTLFSILVLYLNFKWKGYKYFVSK